MRTQWKMWFTDFRSLIHEWIELVHRSTPHHELERKRQVWLLDIRSVFLRARRKYRMDMSHLRCYPQGLRNHPRISATYTDLVLSAAKCNNRLVHLGDFHKNCITTNMFHVWNIFCENLPNEPTGCYIRQQRVPNWHVLIKVFTYAMGLSCLLRRIL